MNAYDLNNSDNMHHGASNFIFSNAKALRDNETLAEKILWEKLRNKRFYGYKFRRQHPIAIFIADFYCHTQKLIIEIDGEYHETSEQQFLDNERTQYFTDNDIKLIRFTNEQVLNDIELVLNEILQNLEF